MVRVFISQNTQSGFKAVSKSNKYELYQTITKDGLVTLSEFRFQIDKPENINLKDCYLTIEVGSYSTLEIEGYVFFHSSLELF
ncbi:hypothetical protein OIU80_20130 [Flavobacterium sp. LS1R47]|uniref:Uncharacterized protein n=1 Tax=Flavobacterium frigoritolerans TaxID=2987686 RepID=A0A9X3HNF8_9FLAO|nr:hypothetical protein [Flavobacterium frigoritolerans]MCV9934597.1 hypothetical protein [Flavobacterium frigoritolerans]